MRLVHRGRCGTLGSTSEKRGLAEVNHKSDKCMSVASGGSTANGAKIVQWTATGRAEQGWRFVARVIDA